MVEKFRKTAFESKKLLLLVFVAIGLFMLINGCRSMMMEMSDGEKLYRSKCSSCHNIIEPNLHDKETWQKYVEEYGKKMTIDEKRLVLQ